MSGRGNRWMGCNLRAERESDGFVMQLLSRPDRFPAWIDDKRLPCPSTAALGPITQINCCPRVGCHTTGTRAAGMSWFVAVSRKGMRLSAVAGGLDWTADARWP
jgi:hypothetical protein